MHDFHSEVVHEIRHPKPLNNNLNKFTLKRIEQSEGVEIATYLMKNNNIGAAKKNPLIRLHKAGKLTQQEFWAGENYQNRFEISQLSHHARPSYDGTPISSASTRSEEGGSSQSQIEASRFIFAAKAQMNLRDNYETIYRNGKFIIVSLKLPEILEAIFEKQIAIRNMRHESGINDRVIEERIKKICEILLAL